MKIEITKNDLGFLPINIKNLLKKLGYLSIDKEEDEIFLNFEKTDTNELSNTIIWMKLNETKTRKNKIKILYKKNAKSYFDERHLFDFTGNKSSIFSSSVLIHYETFQPVRPSMDSTQNDEIESVLGNIISKVLNPENEMHREVKMQITECINNAFDHSESKPDVPAGIICSLKKSKYLDFCVADMGQGIKKSLIDNPLLSEKYVNLEDWEIIEKVTEKNISCNPVNARNAKYSTTNGGLGLYWLKEFVKNHNESKLIIVSGKGYYRLTSNKNSSKSNLDIKWPGVILFFRINVNQKQSDNYKNIVGKKFLEEFENKPFITLK